MVLGATIDAYTDAMMSIFGKKKDPWDTRVYFDYAAATPMRPEVLSAMEPYWATYFGNPGGLHKEGAIAKAALEEARTTCAKMVSARDDELIFTGSGTESNNLAIMGAISALIDGGTMPNELHVITSAIEHPSILECFKTLEKRGVVVTYLPCSAEGVVSLEAIEEALQDNTVLVSVMYANNEVGTIEPIAEIGKIVRRHKKQNKFGDAYPYFHTDASQSPLYIDMNVDALAVDMLTLDGQKMYGPKGVGLLYMRRGVRLRPVIIGGGQESGLRPGTENVPLIVGFAEAFSRAAESRKAETQRLVELRDYCIERIVKAVPNVQLNGPQGVSAHLRMANNVNISIPGIDGEFMVVALSERGFACGTRSACLREGGPSYVLLAMGKPEIAENSLRLSFGLHTTKGHIDRFIPELVAIVENFDKTDK